MKRSIILTLAVFLLTACADSPSTVGEKFVNNILQGNYKEALELTILSDDEKEETRMLLEEQSEKLKEELKGGIAKAIDEKVDKEAGKASVAITITYPDGKTETQAIPLEKGANGRWLVKGL